MTDERIEQSGKTANAHLLDRSIRHAVWIQRYAGGEARRVANFIRDKLLPDLEAQIMSRVGGIRSSTDERLEALRDRYREILAEHLGVVEADQSRRLIGLGRAESRMETEALRRAVPREIDVTFGQPDDATLRSVVVSQPMRGRLLRDWYADLAESTARGIDGEIRIGVAAGESTQEITRRVAGASGLLRRQAESITRTAVTHVANHARQETMRQNEQWIKGVRWVSTLDARTSSICAALDGKVFEIDAGPRPPAHVNCRSTIVPVLKSLRELGITTEDVDLSPSTRASMRGEVPATSTYGTWLEDQSTAVQNAALGPRAADLFRRGVVPVERFVDVSGRPLTLEQLEALEERIESGETSRLPRAFRGEIRRLSRTS